MATAADPAPRSSSAPTPPNPEPSTAIYTVQRGDNLWRIAERQVGPSVHKDAVRSYWVRLIDANDRRLISGKPGLIYPGEVIQLRQQS